MTRDAEWVAPILWRSEFRNILAGFMRRGLLTAAAAIDLQTEAEGLMAGAERDVDSRPGAGTRAGQQLFGLRLRVCRAGDGTRRETVHHGREGAQVVSRVHHASFRRLTSLPRPLVCPSCNGRHMAQTAAHLADFVPNGDGPPAFLPAHPITRAHLVTPTERVRRRMIRRFRKTVEEVPLAGLSFMLPWEAVMAQNP